MGQTAAKPVAAINDFELVIRVSKELEWVLESYFAASGKGLHEKISSAQGLPPQLERRMRYLATIRNKLIHERGFDAIPDRPMFIAHFEESRAELAAILSQQAQQRERQQQAERAYGHPEVMKAEGGYCAIM